MTLSTQPKPQPKPQPQPLRTLSQRDADTGAMIRPSIQRSRADAVRSNGDFRVGRCSWGRANAATIEAGAGEGAGMGKSTTGSALPSSQQTQRHPSMPTHRRLFACLAPFLLAAGVSEAFATPLGLPSDPTAPLRGGADATAAAARPAALSRPIFAATATSSAAQISLSPDEETSAASDEGDAESLPSSSSSSSYRRKIGKHEQPKAQRPTYRRRHELEIEHLEIPLSPPLPSSSSPSSLSKDGANGVFVVGGAGDEDEGGNSDYAAGDDKSTFLPSSVLDSAGTLPVEYVAETNLPTDVGHFRLRAYRIPAAALKSRKIRSALLRSGMGTEPCVIYCTDKPPFGLKGGGGGRVSSDTIKPAEDVPVRIHDQCFTSEVFRSQRCDCKEQLKMALEYIQENGGAIIYLQQEGRGIGLANKVAAYALQDVGMDTVDANIHLGFPEDCRQYGVVPSILEDMGIRSIRLMTNNPRKLERMRALGVNVADTVPMVVERANAYNRKYLETKRERMNHANFGDMLSRTLRPVAATEASMNGMMASRRATAPSADGRYHSVAEAFINEGEELAAAAVASALRNGKEEDDSDAILSLPGVKAREDGYCFGRRSVEDAIAAMARGEMVVVVDDMNRENEGDFIMAADMCTPETMAEIVRYSSGVICVGMEGSRMDALKLPAMVETNEDPKGTAFTITVDASKKHGITTGISAADRSITMKLLASPDCKPSDLVRPGHIFPLRAQDGGVLTRDGHTEAAVDLCKLAGRYPAGVLCEIVSEEEPTRMAQLPELRRFCRKKGYVLTSIVDIAQYRKEKEGK